MRRTSNNTTMVISIAVGNVTPLCASPVVEVALVAAVVAAERSFYFFSFLVHN